MCNGLRYELTTRINIISPSTYRKVQVRYIKVYFDILSLIKAEHDVSKVTVVKWIRDASSNLQNVWPKWKIAKSWVFIFVCAAMLLRKSPSPIVYFINLIQEWNFRTFVNQSFSNYHTLRVQYVDISGSKFSQIMCLRKYIAVNTATWPGKTNVSGHFP